MTPSREDADSASPQAATPSASTAKPQRVLACVQCQQRKVKCDRNFPCANCVKVHARCVPAASLAPRPRRRRFPERELLDRLRRYESLLRQNDIKFDPLHDQSSTSRKDHHLEGRCDLGSLEQGEAASRQDESATEQRGSEGEDIYKAKNIWHAMNQRSSDSEDDKSDTSLNDVRSAIRSAWQAFPTDDHFLFGSRITAVDIPSLHPEQIQIFKLWQTYLDNVNPLLKVTHTPTLQNRIIDAASKIRSIEPTLAALMFGIYSVAILSLDDRECRTMFNESREQLLARYQFACQQALLGCGILHSNDRESLTALYLYLISATCSIDPPSLSCLLSVAIRLAQRMGLHSESTYAKCSPLEGEMRRRLWWSLMLFDTRICELSDNTSVMLVPTWDCKIPLNVSDVDLRPEMKELPPVNGQSTESLFAVVRCELANYIRHSPAYLDFTVPALKNFAKKVQTGSSAGIDDLATLKRSIENRYLCGCNPENPIHFLTLWTTRGFLAKTHLMQTYSESALQLAQGTTDSKRDAAVAIALEMLDCDTKLLASPHAKGYLWLINLYFPFPAYIHLAHELRKRPLSLHTERAWETMSDNYEARGMHLGSRHNFFRTFSKTNILPAWEARISVSFQAEGQVVTPRIIHHIKQNIAQESGETQGSENGKASDIWSTSFDDLSISMPVDMEAPSMLSDLDVRSYESQETFSGQAALDTYVSQLDWNAMDWNPMSGRGW